MQIDRNTVSVVTGAASGIGRALAIRLAREGAALAIADISEAGLRETLQMINGVNVSTHRLDVSDREQFSAFVDDVMRQHGHANLVINNAGVGMAGTAEQLSLDDAETDDGTVTSIVVTTLVVPSPLEYALQ